MNSPSHSSQTSPSFTLSPAPVDNDDETTPITQPLIWDSLPGLGLSSSFPSQSQQNFPSGRSDSDDENSDTAATSPSRKKHDHAQNSPPTSCPPMTGKIRNQYSQRKSIKEAMDDCGDDVALRAHVKRAIESEEYHAGKAVPPELLAPLCEVVGVRSQSKCRFPTCGKMSVRTDRAKEHARVHIGNHPYKCQRVQADGSLGCGATFLRKHDRNRHDNGADVLVCDECNASIQGKGREYNLQRHKNNYCPARKAMKQAEAVAHPSHSAQHPNSTTQPLFKDALIAANPSANGTFQKANKSGPSGTVATQTKPRH